MNLLLPSAKRSFYCFLFLSSIFFLYTGSVVFAHEQESSSSAEPLVSSEVSSDIPQLTTSLEELNKASQKDEEQMKKVAAKRKELLIKEAKKNPEKFLQIATLDEKQNLFPSPIQADLEQKVAQKGELVVVHMDGKDLFKTAYKLKSEKDNKIYNLHFAHDPPELLTGTKVAVEAVQVAQELVVEAPKETADTNFTITQQAVVAGPTTEKTAVILVNFKNDPAQPISKSEIHNLMFTAADSINAYYKENSFNKTAFSGDVFGWFTIDQDNTLCDDNFFNWSQEADQKAIAAGVPLRSFKRLVYVFSSNDCFFGGMGTIGGSPSQSWIFGYYNDRRIYEHELGHNLGLQHANSLRCDKKAIADYKKCYTEEYGDHFDVMGNFWYVDPFSLHFNAPHKMAVGWLSGNQIKKVTSSGTYKIYPLEKSLNTTQALLITKPDTADTYFVSYRQPIGFDAGLFSTITRGASVHIWNSILNMQTQLIDVTPETGGFFQFDDATLADGKRFVDEKNKIEIRQKTHTSEYVEVEVKLNAKPDTTAPEIAITVPKNGSKEFTYLYIPIKIKVSDNVGVAKIEFKRNGKIECTSYQAPYGCLLFTDSKAKKEVVYEAKAYDSANNTKTAKVTIITK